MKDRPVSELRDYVLEAQSMRICRSCSKWMQTECFRAPPADAPAYEMHPWSSSSACEEWKPNAKADAALQELTMRAIKRNINIG